LEGTVEDDFGAIMLNVKHVERLDITQDSCYAGAEYASRPERENVGPRISPDGANNDSLA
jgi:hypothetical protein